MKSQKADFENLTKEEKAHLLDFAPHRGSKTNGNVYDTNEQLPTILCNNRELRDISDEALNALTSANDPPELFIRGGKIVRVRTDEKDNPLIDSVNLDILRGRLSRSANFARMDKGGTIVPIAPSEVVIKDILAKDTWSLPPLERIVEIPIIHPDGSIFQTPGYDPLTGLYYISQTGTRIPPLSLHPNSKDIKAAIDLIKEVLGDFPFIDAASRAASWAACLTLIIRPLISGRTPLILIDSPSAGTGKGLLCGAIAQIATGHPGMMMMAPREDSEMRKLITTVLLNGTSIITFDNLEHQFRSPSLASAITAPIWKDRLLGGNTEVRIPAQVTWLANGNNIRLGGDLPRRSIWCRLDAKVARPWKRTGFKHNDLPGWIDANRGSLIGAFLTLVLAWISEGKPEFSTNVLGGFDDWAKTVGGVLAVAGIEGFLENLEQLYEEADTETAQWEVFLQTWYDHYGSEPKTVAQLTKDMNQECSQLDREPNLQDVLPGNLADFFDKPKSFQRKLGNAIARKIELRHGELRLVKAGEEQRAIRWAVQREITGSQE